MTRLLPLLALLSCQSGSLGVPVPELELFLNGPAYGQFTEASPTVRVSGHVNDPAALVWVEGRQVNVGVDGHFAVDLPVPGPYRVVDVEAANPTAHLRERIPVFRGYDPMDTWPGGMGARITPLGLEALGDSLEPTFEGLNLAQAIFDVLPAIEIPGFTFVPTAVEPGETDVLLAPSATGLDLTITTRGVLFETAFDLALLGAGTLYVGLDEFTIGIEVQPEVDASGMMWLSLGDSTFAMSDLTLETDTIDPVILEDLLSGWLADLGPLAEGAVDGLIGLVGSVPLGGPFTFELDLLGTPVELGIDELYTDLDGLALVLGLDLDGAGNGQGIPAPDPARAHWASHAILTLHEGVIQVLLDSELLDLFGQEIELGGLLGDVLGVPIQALPGGEGAPADATGWCLGVDPGEARVGRLTDEVDRLAMLYFPDMRIDIGVQQGSSVCTPWLDASVALEVGLGLQPDGNLDLDLSIADGAVLGYATDAPWEEEEVIDGLSALVDLAFGLLGGDLGGLFGGSTATSGTPLGLGAIEVLDARPVYDELGREIEGEVNLSLRIF